MAIYDPYFAREVYSKYLQGFSIEEITEYMILYTEFTKTSMDDVNEVIDKMNIFFS